MINDWSDMSDDELAGRWLDVARSGRTDNDGVLSLASLPREEPERAWNVTLIVLEGLTDDEHLLIATLAAGPLEDLLNYHGSDYIDRILERARRDRRFRVAASCVWRSRIAPDIWERLQAIVQPSDVAKSQASSTPQDRRRKR